MVWLLNLKKKRLKRKKPLNRRFFHFYLIIVVSLWILIEFYIFINMKEVIIKNFISKCNIIHNNKYDYSLINYKNARTKIKILCPIHGIFEQSPESHIRNHGCPKCNGGVKLSQEFFIKKSNDFHKNKYDYSLVRYENSSTKIKILCPIHGVFEQRPNEHLKYGCEKCGIEKRSLTKTLTNKEFIKKSNLIHNSKYDYSKTIYTGHINYVTIICSIHGEFRQKANSHLNGCGCPSCRQSKGELKITKFLIENKIKFTPQKRFKDCINIKPLPFDFYLPEYNLCIEYDGIQHYKRMYKTNLENIMLNDKIKTEYCSGQDEKPKLIRISYIDFNNIENILIKIILF